MGLREKELCIMNRGEMKVCNPFLMASAINSSDSKNHCSDSIIYSNKYT